MLKLFALMINLSTYSGDNEIFFLILSELFFVFFIILMIEVRTSTKRITEFS